MNLLIISSAYPAFLADHFERYGKDSDHLTYPQQLAQFHAAGFAWADFWHSPLAQLGYHVDDIVLNAEPLQRRWANENGIDPSGDDWLWKVAVAQAKKFRPEILWYDNQDVGLLRRIREEVPSIKLVLGWVGSALAKGEIWSELDLTLSCAPETVEKLRRSGARAAHLNHAFSPTVLSSIKPLPDKFELTFIGQIVRGSQFHNNREQLLKTLSRES